MSKVMTPEEKEKIINLYKEKGNYEEIAYAIKRSKESVRMLLVQEGLITPRARIGREIEESQGLYKDTAESLRHRLGIGTSVFVQVYELDDQANMIKTNREGKIMALYRHFAQIQVPGKAMPVCVQYADLMKMVNQKFRDSDI